MMLIIFLLAPCSNGNIMLMADIARRNGMRFDVILGADIARDYKPQARVYQASAEAFRPQAERMHDGFGSCSRW
jgi:2-haloacid dehalogenase